MSSPNTLEIALKYLETGFSLFPLAHRSKDPLFSVLPRSERDKATWKPFTRQRPTPAQVTEWFEQGRPNLALVMGRVSASAPHLSLAAIDFDDLAAYDQWSALFPHIANHTPTALTANGAHVLIETRQNVRNWKIMFRGQHVGEMRGEGGYIAAWPSIHPSGKPYEWVISPFEVAPIETTLEHIGLASAANGNGKVGAGAPASAGIGRPQPDNGKYPLPPRTLAFMASGQVVGKGINDELYHAAIQHAAAGYTEPETIDALLPVAVAHYIGTGPGNTEAAALRTIKSGWKGGQGKEPLTWGLGSETSRSKLSPESCPNGVEPQNLAGKNGQSEPAPTNGNGLGQPGQPGELDTGPKTRPNHPRYYIQGQHIIYESYKKVGDDLVTVKNPIPFTGQVKRKLTLFQEDGTQAVTYTITGQKDGQPYALDVEAADFADGKKLYTRLLDYLPGGPPAIPNTLIRHVNTAIAAISPQDQIKTVNALPSMGWTPDCSAFVMPSGSVGVGDYQCKIPDSIAKEFSEFGFRENTPEENKRVLDALLYLEEVYGAAPVLVSLAHVFLPPLLRWLGTQARYLLHLHAGSGSLKTELAKLLIRFYGPAGDAAITYKWSGTPYGIDSRANAAKDCLILLDDLKPNTLKPDDIPKWVAFIQAYVDAAPRKRATIGGGGAASLPPRALLVSTGEAIPEAGEASYTARMLLVELRTRGENEPRADLLDKVRDEMSHLFPGLMQSYLQWLMAGNGDRALEWLRRYQNDSIQAAHSRLIANYAANRTAARMLAEFLLDTGLWNEVDRNYFLERHKSALLAVVGATGQKVKDERYSQRFIAALRDALSTGFARISDSAADQRRVGWQDGEYVYLLNGSLAIVNQWLRNSGESPLIIPMREIRKQLFEDGYTYTTPARAERGEYDAQRVDPADQSKPMVVAVYRPKFYSLDISEEAKAP